MSDERDKDKPAWSTTEPLPKEAVQPGGASPDSSGAFDASGQPKKIAEVKRSAEVESMLEALSYPRPHAKAAKAITDADMAAAHHVGPRAAPAATITADPEAPIVLSHSLVEAIQAPPQRPAGPAAVQGTTVVVRPRSRGRILVAALAAGAALLLVWAFERTREAPPAHEVVVAPVVAAPTIAPAATPPVVTTVTSAATAVEPSASAQSAQAPVLAASASARPHKGAPVPRASAGKPAPATSAQEPSLRTDFQIEN